ncbi:S-adenosylmethionine:tRNA ribosyltransferase-isomerase [Pseudovibrio axinellae]|uniref:S-adenosylmethionine:tRNA ribosyltransferase-isomerase n=1 Tax=Pseudovibrio axinellae TaxID=989403 RepID=A0A166A8G0_9HYPH|nr:tRNA preQ1(34) S-adenosylmethionine ribosyltransferase-isomerase QueA [Pseudovibrio axinellae]KZL20723.1 S-adenosylmethionine:tRNA ribosyltransferase-isomerase [Pseudovibrio axinellae]SER24663.1 S-adenosylmethionine:tRNA ribosyltransferase-isomerase [Pseudovibrio axinellae]
MNTVTSTLEIPLHQIASEQISPKDAAKLMVVKPEDREPLSDRKIIELPQILRPGDLIVFNDTKVIPTEIRGYRSSGGASQPISMFLSDQKTPDCWTVHLKDDISISKNEKLTFFKGPKTLEAAVKEKTGRVVELQFQQAGLELKEHMARIRNFPEPPFLNQLPHAKPSDKRSYQTVFAKNEGAALTPSASLHFTHRLLKALDTYGISSCNVTLHVGTESLFPSHAVKDDDKALHSEWGEITKAAANKINQVRAMGGRIIAVGTTVMRLLESSTDKSQLTKPFRGTTDIFIKPGFQFRATDALITNFHPLDSTLFLLVSAFSGQNMMLNAYKRAISHNYRFLSFGDSSLLFRASTSA